MECKRNPELKAYPVAVCGSVEDRHGIVLAKNHLAKAKGVITGEPVWQAKEKCPGLVVVPPNFDDYVEHSGERGRFIIVIPTGLRRWELTNAGLM